MSLLVFLLKKARWSVEKKAYKIWWDLLRSALNCCSANFLRNFSSGKAFSMRPNPSTGIFSSYRHDASFRSKSRTRTVTASAERLEARGTAGRLEPAVVVSTWEGEQCVCVWGREVVATRENGLVTFWEK